MTALDGNFLRRVYGTSALVTVLVAICCWDRWGLPAAVGVLSGVLVSLGCLYLTERGVRSFIRPGVKSYTPLLLYAAGTYPALLALLYLLTTWKSFNPAAFMGGVLLPHAVIVLKVLGRRLVAPRPGAEVK